MNTTSIAVGHFLVTPLTKKTDIGDYIASVSIRRGMHDRIFRFVPRFSSAAAAARYALTEARALLRGARG